MSIRQNTSAVSIAIKNTLFDYNNNNLPLIKKVVPQEFTIKIANTIEEREEVFRLAYQVYLKKGFIKENSHEWHLQSYDANQETIVLIVQDQQKNIAGSVTLVFENDSKLPAEKIYREELKKLKESGYKLAEISRLVISTEYRNSKEILVLLFNYLAIYTHHVKNYNCVIVEVNPRHKAYYQSLLNFDVIGFEKPCPQVQNAPAVLLYLSTVKYQFEVIRCGGSQNKDKKERSLYPYFLKTEQELLVSHYLKKQVRPMTAEEKIYFGFTESSISRAVCV